MREDSKCVMLIDIVSVTVAADKTVGCGCQGLGFRWFYLFISLLQIMSLPPNQSPCIVKCCDGIPDLNGDPIKPQVSSLDVLLMQSLSCFPPSPSLPLPLRSPPSALFPHSLSPTPCLSSSLSLSVLPSPSLPPPPRSLTLSFALFLPTHPLPFFPVPTCSYPSDVSLSCRRPLTWVCEASLLTHCVHLSVCSVNSWVQRHFGRLRLWTVS